MTSSIVTMMGTATQGAYCAANAFLDAFARFPVSQGLLGQALALGLVLEVGFVSQLPETQKAMIRNGIYGTSEADFLDLLRASFVAQDVGDEWQEDPLARAHLLTGLEPCKLAEVYEGKSTADFIWHTDARFSNL